MLFFLDGVTSTAAELNILDGSATTQSSVTLASGDGIIISDASDSETMKQALVSDIATYVQSATSLGDLTDALIEDNSLYLGNDPSSTTSTAEKNVGVGTIALTSVTQGDENTAVGYDALTSLTTGHKNVSVGVGALNSLTTGHGNMAVGYNALNNVCLLYTSPSPRD